MAKALSSTALAQVEPRVAYGRQDFLSSNHIAINLSTDKSISIRIQQEVGLKSN